MAAKSPRGALHYSRVPEDWRKGEKLDFLRGEDLRSVDWRGITPNTKSTWMRTETEGEFESFLPIGSKQAKRASTIEESTIFRQFSSGVKTNRDMVVHDFDHRKLRTRMRKFVDAYNYEVWRFMQATQDKSRQDWPDVDEFVDYSRIKWDGTLKGDLRKGNAGQYDEDCIRNSLYRPFTKKCLYFDRLFNNSVYRQPHFFPNANAESNNLMICVAGVASMKLFQTIIVDQISCLDLLEKTQCFPFYTYDRDGSNRRENITDFALACFREQYADPRISKWDIFHYVYALLHHPGYRARYALDLKRSLPRIPFAPEFRAFARAGSQLADLHLDYETADRYSLEWDTGGKQIDFRVERMRPRNKRDSDAGDWKVFDSLQYNDTLTLRGIPERAFAYRLGNRSALEWVVDQYRVKHDKRSGITHDANDYSDDARYIVDLLSRVITVSLKTMDVVDKLAGLGFR